jgi:hypothetical protein
MLTNAQHLHDRARHCRELADTAVTEEGRLILREIAERYECEANTAEQPDKLVRIAEVAA